MNSDHIRIAKGIATVAFFVFLSKFAGAIKEIVVAMEFGVGAVVDAYFLIFTLVIWIPSIWNSVMTVAFVPLSKQAEPEQQRLFNKELFGFAILLGGCITVGFMLFTPTIMTWAFSNATESTSVIAAQIAPIMAPMILGGFVASYLSARLLAKERHSNTLADGIPSICIAAVILLWPYQVNENHMAWSNVIGVFIQIAGLTMLARRSQSQLGLSIGFKSNVWHKFKYAIGWMLAGQIIISFNQPIDVYLASTVGTGAISEFGYAKKVLALLLGLGGVAVGRAILPVLSDSSRDVKSMFKIGRQWSFLLMLAGFCCIAVLWFLSETIVRLLFERGNFSTDNTDAVVAVLQYGLFQLPFYFSGIVLVQLFASLGHYRYIFYSGCLALAVKLLSGVVLVQTMGVPGLMLSTAIMYFSTWALFNYLVIVSANSESSNLDKP